MVIVRWLAYALQCLYLALVLPGAGEGVAEVGAALAQGARAGALTARAFLLGAGIFLPLAWWLRGALRFWYALAHEVTHGLAAVLLGGRLEHMSVGASGEGEVRFARRPFLLWLVLLAPYVLNPAYLAALPVPFLDPAARPWGALAAGFGAGFALVGNALQVRAYQSDIRRAGLVRSLLFITWGNLCLLALAAALATLGPEAAARVLRRALVPPL